MVRFNRTSGIGVVAGFLLVITSASAAPLSAIQRIEQLLGILDETDAGAPVDYGPGPGLKQPEDIVTRRLAASQFSTPSPAFAPTPAGGATARTTGVFGPAVTWPLIPIHAVLLPDGRVMNYGTSANGAQGAQLIYDVWDPALGTGTNSHMVLPNTTNTDIFCGAQSVMLSGDVLTSGGDLTVNGVRYSANNDTTIFSPTANSLTANTPMSYARWYGSLVALPSGQLAMFGGRQNVGVISPIVPATTPELYHPSINAWTTLTGASSTDAFGTVDWYYPRAFVAPGGRVFVLAHTGGMFYVSTAWPGSITKSTVAAPVGNSALPTISFAPGWALSLRMNRQVVVVDYRTSTPLVTPTDSMDQVRYWANGTLLADGKVLVSGGSQVQNALTGVAYKAQIWDPATGHWTAGATAAKPRLYHSISMLLPDATVLTGGGGAPGPVKNLNAEIYYPPYLYAANGAPAVRPVISSMTSSLLNNGDTLSITVGATDIISRLTFVHTGSPSHSTNLDQRFLDLAYSQEGQHVTAVLPASNSILVPGYYMLFAFNASGAPSLASIVKVM